MHLNITFEIGVTLAVLAGLVYGLIKQLFPGHSGGRKT